MKPSTARWFAAIAVVCAGPLVATADDVDLQIRFWESRNGADPEDDIALTKLGTAYLLKARRSGEYEYYSRSEVTLRAASKINPGSYDARVSLAFALGAQHKFKDALALAEQAVKDRPGEAEGYGILGDAALETGDLKRAESAYTTLVDLAPGLFAFGRIANLRMARGDTPGALDSLNRAIEAGRSRGASRDEIARCQVALGEIHWGRGRYDEAERHYQDALKTNPESYLPLEHLAELRASQGRHDEALALYRKAIALAPHPDFFEAVGEVHAAMGRADEAKTWRDRALAGYREKVDQGDVGYFRHLAHFYSDVQPDPAEAIRWAKKDLEIRPEALSYDALAWAYHRAGSDGPAVEAVARAQATGIDDARVLYHAGMIYHRAGDAKSSRSLLKRALEVNPRLPEADAVRRLLGENGG